jgi:hypothetical protein
MQLIQERNIVNIGGDFGTADVGGRRNSPSAD